MTDRIPDDEPENGDFAAPEYVEPETTGQTDGLFGVFSPEATPSPDEQPSSDAGIECSNLFSLPIPDFLQAVIARCQQSHDRGAWRSPMFEFTRWVKARRELTALDGLHVAERIEPDLRLLAPEGEDPWQYHFEGGGADDARAEFIETWSKIRTPADMDALQVAARLAERRPLQPRRVYSPKYCQLVSIAGHLQRLIPNKAIALPVERLAELIGGHRRTVGIYLKFALKENLLCKVAECVPHNRAAEFTFSIDRFDWSTGRQIK